MVKEGRHKVVKKPISVLLVEGETDEIFYKRVKSICLTNCRITIRHFEGLYNINAKIIERIVNYVREHADEVIRVYCCLDRESRYGEVPGFDINKIKRYIKDEKIKSVLSVYPIKATQQIESWFFYDIEGIYRFLKVPRPRRNPNFFKPPEKFGYKDLQRLFEKHGKIYNKGKKGGHFIDNLNIGKIVSSCRELREGIELIRSQGEDLTNRLFPGRRRRSS